MVFSSIPFLYYFIPCVLAAYFIAPKGFKNSVLLLSSLFFYAWGEPKYLVFMLVSITQGYVFGILIEKHREKKRSKAFLAASVLFSLLLLGYFKYADFFIANFNAVTGLSIPLLNIALPIGISFYTFQILSYTVDVYRGEAPAQKNYINLATYIAMFPQLVAGPIVRYTEIARQLESRAHSMENAAVGIRKFILGLSKKVLIANLLGELVSAFQKSGDKSVLFFWLYAVAFTLQIYFDFSGYSDMAIGLGRVFGFRFAENFQHPYVSRSVTEFWRRWHISLGTWFRDYLYIPLGGNRVSKGRWVLNLLIVWAATGFWHGAQWNFILWGLFFAVLLILEKLWLSRWLKKRKVISHLYVMLVVILGFVLFDASSVSQAFASLSAMFGFSGLPFTSGETLYYLKSYGLLLAAAAVGATPLAQKLFSAAQDTALAWRLWNAAEPVGLLALLVVCTGFLVDGSFNPFLYFRF